MYTYIWAYVYIYIYMYICIMDLSPYIETHHNIRTLD